MLNNASILVTGGTGSFGQYFVRHVLKQYSPKKVIIFSRDEMKQWEMAKNFQNDARLRFFLGDVRDYRRLSRAMVGVDYVVHAAASKIVPIAEYNPFEYVKTNVNGAMNVIDTALDNDVKKVVALSTDKASSPINLYGATKLVSDKLFVSANSYSGSGPTRFAVVRYGNVFNSRGSVVPYFLSLPKSEAFPITDPRMTRFVITLKQGVEFVIHALTDARGGEIYVKKLPSVSIESMAKAIDPLRSIEVVGVRPGEKIHEEMISHDEAKFVREFEDYYKILPAYREVDEIGQRCQKGKPVGEDFSYSSGRNSSWLNDADINMLIREHYGSAN